MGYQGLDFGTGLSALGNTLAQGYKDRIELQRQLQDQDLKRSEFAQELKYKQDALDRQYGPEKTAIPYSYLTDKPDLVSQAQRFGQAGQGLRPNSYVYAPGQGLIGLPGNNSGSPVQSSPGMVQVGAGSSGVQEQDDTPSIYPYTPGKAAEQKQLVPGEQEDGSYLTKSGKILAPELVQKGKELGAELNEDGQFMVPAHKFAQMSQNENAYQKALASLGSTALRTGGRPEHVTSGRNVTPGGGGGGGGGAGKVEHLPQDLQIMKSHLFKLDSAILNPMTTPTEKVELIKQRDQAKAEFDAGYAEFRGKSGAKLDPIGSTQSPPSWDEYVKQYPGVANTPKNKAIYQRKMGTK